MRLIKGLEDVTSLMSIYLSEWEHRDNLFWKQAFAYFTAIITLSALPYINIWVTNFPAGFPKQIFPFVGIVLSILFMFVMWAYTKRLNYLRTVYFRLMDRLPDDYNYKLERMKDTKPEWKKPLYRWQMAIVITVVMFFCMIAVGIVSLMFL